MDNLGLLIGRILAAAIFIDAGFTKAVHLDGTVLYLAATGLPVPEYTVFAIIALEFFGGLMILFGFLTRPLAVLFALFTVMAAWIGHRDFSDTMHYQAFMKDLAIAGGYLFLAVAGPGSLSVDAWRDRHG